MSAEGNPLEDMDVLPPWWLDVATGERLRGSLVEAVVTASRVPWDIARLRWHVTDMTEDETASSECVCGQTGLRYRFTIADDVSGAELFPIGSDCIAHFDVLAMTSAATVLADFAALTSAARGGVLDLKGDLSRRRLALLHRRGMLADREFEFLVSMFNRRREMTLRQQGWAHALMVRLTCEFAATGGAK